MYKKVLILSFAILLRFIFVINNISVRIKIFKQKKSTNKGGEDFIYVILNKRMADEIVLPIEYNK